MCGNCFHPSLISSALGSDVKLREWINDHLNCPTQPVANQQQTFAVFAKLCDEVQREGALEYKDQVIHFEKEPPPLMWSAWGSMQSTQEIWPWTAFAKGVSRSSSPPSLQCPDLNLLTALHTAVLSWEKHSGYCSFYLLSCWLPQRVSKDHFGLLGMLCWSKEVLTRMPTMLGQKNPSCCLSTFVSPNPPRFSFFESCYCIPRSFAGIGVTPPVMQQFWCNRGHHDNSEFAVEQRDGQWVINVGPYHCQQAGCVAWFLAQLRAFAHYPWHPNSDGRESTPFEPLHCPLFLCQRPFHIGHQRF